MSECPMVVTCCPVSPWPVIPPSVATQLGGLVWSMPCVINEGPFCTSVDPLPVVTTMQGPPGETFEVVLRIRGLVELKAYPGGIAVIGTGGYCTVGGAPNPLDGSNTYKLQISDPATTYYLNTAVPFWTGLAVPVDYTFQTPIKVGATVTMIAQSIDGQQRANPSNVVVPVLTGDPPIRVANPFGGQFLQMDVVSVL